MLVLTEFWFSSEKIFGCNSLINIRNSHWCFFHPVKIKQDVLIRSLPACRRLLFPLLHAPFSACNKGNRRRLHAGKLEARNSSSQAKSVWGLLSSRLRVVPHFYSGIVEWAKRERAWKSPHARKGDTPSRFARSTIPEEKWGTTRSLIIVLPTTRRQHEQIESRSKLETGFDVVFGP